MPHIVNTVFDNLPGNFIRHELRLIPALRITFVGYDIAKFQQRKFLQKCIRIIHVHGTLWSVEVQ